MKKSKLYFKLFTGLMFVSFFIKCGETQSPVHLAENKKALIEIKKEIKVKEAIITDANVLYVTVDDDGTPRNGYADYLCEVLKENNSTVTLVKVIKFGSTNDAAADNVYGVLLGESTCNY
ncbi:MAG: hypothetical protein EOO45_11095 [Flavobacterium sp.]|nr:MAG: hypothetical protein EOO45_11095 [Flavobacterium sp.]